VRAGIFLSLALLALLAMSTPAVAGDVLWFTGHSGYDEGHVDIFALLTAAGATVDLVETAPLPDLAGYSLIFVSLPGFFDGGDYFTADEKARLNTWLSVGSRRIVPIGEWDGFYAGQDVMEDLLAAIGNPIVFVPGAWDVLCGHCSGTVTDDPVVDGLDHVCYAYTATWDPTFGEPVAYAEDPGAPGPYIMSNGTDIPCIVGIADGNVTSDPCGYLAAVGGDDDSKEFHRRLYNITCSGVVEWACCLPDGSCTLMTREDCAAAGGTYYDGLACNQVECEPTAVHPSTWGKVKATYR
jgi:hypothetical protein